MGHQDVLIAPVSSGTPPGAPTSPTSITKDAGATISFLPPVSVGSSAIVSYTVTPYIGATAQTPTTVPIASLSSITGSDGNTYKQANVTGLTNGTAYTFTVKATNSQQTGSESVQTGANTPLAGLVFGDDFNGPTIDPEWWVYTRCGYLKQSEVQYYLPSQVTLSGGNLVLTAQHTSHTGPSYPSAGGGTVTQPWISGAVQSNTRTFKPSAGNFMTFEVRQQVMADAGNGFWPGLFWLEGQAFLDQWKTDPDQPGWDNATQAEIDVAEWFMSGTPNSYGTNTYGNTEDAFTANSVTGTIMNVYQAKWKPGVSNTFFLNGTQTHQVTNTGQVASSSTQFFLLLYLQMLTGGPTTTESCLIDYVRVFDAP